jgi:hypothetical protein
MAQNMEGVTPEAKENVSGTAVEEMYADPSDNDEVDEDEAEAEAEEQEFTDEAEEDGGAGADEEDEEGKTEEGDKPEGKKTQTSKENAENARRRREQEQAQRIEAASRKARVDAIIDALDGKNPYTGEPMKDAHDVAVYETMKRIEKSGGDPVKDFARASAEDARKAEATRTQADADSKWYADDLAAFRKAYPRVDVQKLIADPDFREFAEAQVQAKVPLAQIYGGYEKLRAKFQKEADRKVEEAKDGAAQALANARAGVGGKAGSADNLGGVFFTPEEVKRMTPAEIEKNREAIRKSMSRWN